MDAFESPVAEGEDVTATARAEQIPDHTYRRDLNHWIVCSGAVSLYMLVGACVYQWLEPEWSFLSALYFTMVTISTVGYGCISPTSVASRVFTMFYVVTSIPIFTGFLGEAFRPLIESLFNHLDRAMFSRLSALRSDDDDPLHPPSTWQFYGRGLVKLLLFAHMGACMVLSMMCFLTAEAASGAFANTLEQVPLPEPLLAANASVASVDDSNGVSGRLFDAFYFIIITSATVGYGDICPATETGRAFTLVAAGLGLAVINLFVTKFQELVEEREAQVLAVRRNHLELSLACSGAELVAKFDHSGDGKLDRAEFVYGMLMALEIVTPDVVAPLLARFDGKMQSTASLPLYIVQLRLLLHLCLAAYPPYC